MNYTTYIVFNIKTNKPQGMDNTGYPYDAENPRSIAHFDSNLDPRLKNYISVLNWKEQTYQIRECLTKIRPVDYTDYDWKRQY